MGRHSSDRYFAYVENMNTPNSETWVVRVYEDNGDLAGIGGDLIYSDTFDREDRAMKAAEDYLDGLT